MPTTTLRDATPYDARPIAEVHVATWRTTYPGIMPQEHLDTLSVGQFAADWANRLADSRAEGQTRILVAEDEAGQIVGFSSGGPERTGDAEYPGEIYTLYLLQALQGRGLGRRLLTAMARRLSEDGYPALMLWTHIRNPARAFYEAMGGQNARTRQRVVSGVTYDDVGYGWNADALARLTTDDTKG